MSRHSPAQVCNALAYCGSQSCPCLRSPLEDLFFCLVYILALRAIDAVLMPSPSVLAPVIGTKVFMHVIGRVAEVLEDVRKDYLCRDRSVPALLANAHVKCLIAGPKVNHMREVIGQPSLHRLALASVSYMLVSMTDCNNRGDLQMTQ